MNKIMTMLKQNRKIMRMKHLIQIVFYNLKTSAAFIEMSEKVPDEERKDYVLSVAAHTIEKGLGCMTYKAHWGEEKALRLLELMAAYIEEGSSQACFGFSEAYAVMTAYIVHKDTQGERIPKIKRLYDNLTKRLDDSKQEYAAGKRIYTREELTVDYDAGIHLLETCRSIRNYSQTIVDEQDILDAIKIAAAAPSACNRQPIKCYYTMDEEKIARCDALIPGNVPIRGTTTNYIVITASRQYFGLYEYNQWYVNGGIFLSYLRLGLHLKNIGSCIYQWPINANEKKMRELYQIPRTELIVGVVGIGYFPDKAHCICAQRKRVEDYAVRVV